MSKRRSFLDEIDKEILKTLQNDCRIPMESLAQKLGVSVSTVHYRIKRLEDEEIISGYHAKINLSDHQDEFLTAILISAKFEKDYINKIEKLLKSINEIWAVYFVLGAQNFIVLAKTKGNNTFMKKVYSKIVNSNLISNAETLVISKIIKEEQRKFFEINETKN